MSKRVSKLPSLGGNASVISIPPYEFIHVLDTNSNVTVVVPGPSRYTRQDHERIVLGPEPMVSVPPRHYVTIQDPIVRDEDGKPTFDQYGQIKLRFGDSEIRLASDYPDPFPLFPGETQWGDVEELEVVPQDTALRLEAIRDFGDRKAGDEWLFLGPGTYEPRVDVQRVEKIDATVIKHGMALRIRARRNCSDHKDKARKAGEEWLVREEGAYLPKVDETVLQTVNAFILTEKKALHLVALKSFVDIYGKARKAGEEWLVNMSMAETHICDVYEKVMGEVELTTLTDRQYVVVVNPWVNGVQRLGAKELRQGEQSFFLQPGEELEKGIESVHVLGDDEALLLRANQAYHDKSVRDTPWHFVRHATGKGTGTDSGEESEGKSDAKHIRSPGDLWMVYGPCEYVPPTEVTIIERRRALPLDENEGIYVRDTKSGRVTAVIGETYMPKPHEEMYEKHLPPEVERLLARQAGGQAYVVPSYAAGDAESLALARKDARAKVASGRNRSSVVTFRVPHNAAVQVYDFKKKTSRVVFGPDLIMLGPDEQFTIIRLSGDKPKRPNVITSLCLMLGPDFMTDIITVETSDHARLSITLSYNWHFDIDPDNPSKIFAVRDFTGDACKAIASRVRGAVAGETFDNFHKYSAKIVRGSIFGFTPEGKVGDVFRFDANNLVITNVDVQSVEPVDERTRESLQKSVQLAIEITTKSQEARAHQEAKREEEEAKGLLEQQRLKNEAQCEATRMDLLKLQVKSNTVEAEGKATSEAQGRAAAQQIAADAAVAMAKAKAEALNVEAQAELNRLKAKNEAEIAHQHALNQLEVEKAEKLAEIEAKKFQQTVTAIGQQTIAEIARAGPEMQAKLLQGLGLTGFLVTDGKSPINLFNTAQGMIANPQAQALQTQATAGQR